MEAEKLKRKALVLTITLIAVILISLFVAIELVSEWQFPEFFVGVEFAYSNNVSDLKDLVNKVKNYTNLFVLGEVRMSFNQTALYEACDYIYDAGLSFIILFTDTTMYNQDQPPSVWIFEAKQKYGDKFLGVYRYDEPGGNQLDQGRSRMLDKKNATALGNYSNAARHYVDGLHIHIGPYLNVSDRLFTADYGLYWFDYKAGYSTVFAEFGWNFSRQLHVALCRGAATAQNRTWGAIVTWKYNGTPYLESGNELYSDLNWRTVLEQNMRLSLATPELGRMER